MASLHSKVLMEKQKELLRQHPYSIWQGKNGEWFTYVIDSESPSGTVRERRRLKKRNSKKELEDLLLEYYDKLNNDKTIKDVFYEWVNWKLELGKICNSTHYRYIVTFEQFYGEFGKRKLSGVTEDEYQDFLERLIPKYRLTVKGFSNVKTITRGLLKWGKRKGYISWNAEYMLSNIETSKNDFRHVVKEDCEEVFDEDEAELITNYLKKHPDRVNLGLLLLFATGIRVGELATLRHEDLGEDYIRIRRTETFWMEGKSLHFEVKDFPKTAAGWRDVVLPTRYIWLIERFHRWQGDYLFQKQGKRCNAKVFENRMRTLCRKLGIVHKSPHKIRKTYGTILMDNAVDTNMIIQQMGHTSIITSEKHYHRNRKSHDRKRMILDQLPDFRL